MLRGSAETQLEDRLRLILSSRYYIGTLVSYMSNIAPIVCSLTSDAWLNLRAIIVVPMRKDLRGNMLRRRSSTPLGVTVSDRKRVLPRTFMSTSNLSRALFTPSFTVVLAVSAVLRVALILYSEWHDARSVVKYTDVDYRVFSDAAHFVLHPTDNNKALGPFGEWLGLGDPYTRATYRYTPLLALLLTPNEWLHQSFGKYLFAACDLLIGLLMHQLLVTRILPSIIPLAPAEAEPVHGDEQAIVPTESATGKKEKVVANPEHRTDRASVISNRATLLVASHLLNPLVFSISTRGSSESVLSFFVLATLYFAYSSRWDAAAILLGLSTHWKIYPFVYGLACLGAIGSERGSRKWWQRLLTSEGFRFAFLSAGTFALLSGAMYAIWGYPFLHESYLYHLHRLDHRHNFSPYFYPIYLAYPGQEPLESLEMLPIYRQIIRSPLTSFVPQMVLTLGAGILFGRRKGDLAFAWFVQTFAFVVFNKVCTSQYFLWYTLFLPLLIPQLSLSTRRALQLLGVWVGTQALWLSEAYKLEFLGQNVFFSLWVRGLVYVIGHAWVLAGLMDSYQN